MSFFSQAKYNWDFYTVPQKHMDGRRLHQPRGRALGGSSSLNAMAYVSLGVYVMWMAGAPPQSSNYSFFEWNFNHQTGNIVETTLNDGYYFF